MTQLPLPSLAPKSDWKLPRLQDLPCWRDAKRVAIDIETHDPQLRKMGPGVRRDGRMIGASFAIEEGPSAYLPFGHLTGAQLDEELVLSYLQYQAECFRGEIVGANLTYDLDYLWQRGVKFEPSFHRDVLLAEPLLDENQFTYSLEATANRRLGTGKEESLLDAAAKAYGVDPKAELWKLPSHLVGPYAEADATIPLQVLTVQEKMIAEQRLGKVFDLECELLPGLLRMQRRGVKIDQDRLGSIETDIQSFEMKTAKEISRLSGIKFHYTDITKPTAVDRVLKERGINIPPTPTGKPGTSKEALEEFAQDKVVQLLLEAKVQNKLRTTFVKSIWRYMIGDRIHCSFNQLKRQKEGGKGNSGTVTGRLSATHPNLQQQPGRGEIGKLWRSIYIPDEGGKWACLDFSSQEPRWISHFAYKTPFKHAVANRVAERVVKEYRSNDDLDFHQKMADILKWKGKEGRKKAKAIFLGLCYGMGGAKLCRSIGLPTKMKYIEKFDKEIEVAGEEGWKILQQFKKAAPHVYMLNMAVMEAAKKRGYITTAGGSRCRFERDERGQYDFLYKAPNRLIQGSSAYQIKYAMRDADREGVPLQLQVHDELDLTVWSEKEARDLEEIMLNAIPCEVPAKVDIEIGPNWGEIEKI